MKVCTVILGAGKSSRMNSNIPKPFHKIANLKLIDWILNLLNSVKMDKKIIVTSKNVNFSAYKNIAEIVVQKNQLGTGDAVLTTHEKLKKLFIEYEANDVLIKKIISIGPDISYQIESLKN